MEIKIASSPVGLRRVHCGCTTDIESCDLERDVADYFNTGVYDSTCPICHRFYFYFVNEPV